MATNFDSRINQSYLAQQMTMLNFCPQISALLAVTSHTVPVSITFTPLTGSLRSTFQITNKGAAGAYIGWGVGTATAQASTPTPAANCHYVAAGAILVLDFQSSTNPSTGPIDTLAAVFDASSTNLEITYGSGQ